MQLIFISHEVSPSSSKLHYPSRFFAYIRLLEDIIECSFFLLASAVIDIDSVGTFTMCHEALKYLKKGGPGKDPSNGGTIINISATLHYTATWYQIHVSAAKVCKLWFASMLIIFELTVFNLFTFFSFIPGSR